MPRQMPAGEEMEIFMPDKIDKLKIRILMCFVKMTPENCWRWKKRGCWTVRIRADPNLRLLGQRRPESSKVGFFFKPMRLVLDNQNETEITKTGVEIV